MPSRVPSESRRAARLVAALGLVLAACAPEAPPPTVDPTGPLLALPACTTAPPPSGDDAPEGIELPDGAVITSVTPQDPLTQLTAYVALTPVQLRLAYEARPDLTLLLSEDEIFEAELLVSNGAFRTYVKASAICSDGSNMIAVVAPELDAGGLPVPSRAATPGQ